MQQYGRRIEEWFRELKEPYTTHTFDAGKLGIEADAISGEITKVTSDKPDWKTGLHVGWTVRKINGQPYSDRLSSFVQQCQQAYNATVERHVPTNEQMRVLGVVRDRVC